MRHARQIAITEVWLDRRAEAMRPAMGRVPEPWDWPAVVGRVLAAAGAAMLVIEYWNALGGAR